MPIYGYGLLGAPYELGPIPVKDLAELLKIFNKAKREFEYKNNKQFLSSIKMVNKANIIAKYDMNTTSSSPTAYTTIMEKLIRKCNELKDSKLDDYMFDIMGNWQVGTIVIMTKNKNYSKKLDDIKVKVVQNEPKKKHWYDKSESLIPKKWWE